MNIQLLESRISDPGVVKQLGLLERVDTGHAEEVGDLGEVLAVAGLQAADEVPVDGAREKLCLVGEFLGVVFAEMGVGGGSLVEGEDVGGRL